MKPPLTFYFKFLKGAENAHINVHGSFSQQYPHEKQNNVNATGQPKKIQIWPLNKNQTATFGNHFTYFYLHLDLDDPDAAKIALKGCFPIAYNCEKEIQKREIKAVLEQAENRKSMAAFIERVE